MTGVLNLYVKSYGGVHCYVPVKPKQWELDILLAEDTDSEVELFQMALKLIGRVRSLSVVRDGEQAISFLRGEPPFELKGRPSPNVIVLDLKMPKLSGLEVLEWLRQHPECSVIPTVVFSNSMHESDIEEAYKLGANAFFAKPSQFEQLKEILELILGFWDRALRPVLKNPVCQ